MASARFPSFDGLQTELFALRQGHGLSILTVEKINSTPNVLRALGVSLDSDTAPSDRARDARQELIKFIASCDALTSADRTALTYILNLDGDLACYRKKLPARRIDLELALRIGRRKVRTLERAAILVLAEELLKDYQRA